MKKMKQRILSYILVGLLVLGMFPVQAFAMEQETGDVQEMMPLSDGLEEDETVNTMEESQETNEETISETTEETEKASLLEDGLNTMEDTLELQVSNQEDNQLQEITIGTARTLTTSFPLSPVFDSTKTDYTCTVDSGALSTMNLYIKVVAVSSDATIKASYLKPGDTQETEVTLTSGTAAALNGVLNNGVTSLKITVTPSGDDGTNANVYTVNINRLPSLSSILVQNEEKSEIYLISPSFKYNNFKYSVVVPSDKTKLAVNAVPKRLSGTATINEVKAGGILVDNLYTSYVPVPDVDNFDIPIQVTDNNDGVSTYANYTVSVTKSYNISFTLTEPVYASVEVKNSEGTVMTPGADGTYTLTPGEYQYTVTAQGYVAENQNFSVGKGNETSFNIELARGSDYSDVVNVEHLIDFIGEITLNGSKQSIDKARAAYNALEDAEKLEVTNYDVLIAAEKLYTQLLEAAGGGDSESTLNWTQFLGNEDLKGVSDAKTPQKGEDMEELWRSDLHNGNVMMNHISAPAYYNGSVYYSLNDTIVKVDAETGETLASAEAAKSGMLLPQVTVGGEKVFVMTIDSDSGGCRVKVYSADTLEFLYQTVVLRGNQIETPIMYHDGYFYFATYGSKGAYYAFVAPEGKQTKDLSPEWQKNATGTVGYVWAGMEFIGEDIGVFGDTNANLFSVNRSTGEVLDTYVFPEGTQIQSTPNYYEKNQRLYVTTAMNGGSILSIKMNSDGTFDRSSEKWFISDLGGSGIKSSPVIYNDRLYVCGGGGHGGSNEPFRVIDANTMTVIYEIEEIGSKGTPVLSTAYATEENGHKVYLYVVPYKPDSTTSAMYIIQDSQGQTEPIYEKVDNIGSKQYCSQTITIGDNGLMYYYNDANYVYAYGLKDLNSRLITGEDVDQQIKRMPEVDEYKYYNDVEIKRIKERYDNLSDSEKQKVTLYQKLIDILAISYMSPVERMNSGIAAIPDMDLITLEDRDMIENLYQGYYRMEEADRLLVEDPDKLLAAYAQIPVLEKKVITDAIVADIDKLPEVAKLGIANKAAVDSLIQRVEALDASDQPAITNMDKLNSAKERVDAIEAQLAKVDQLIQDTLEGVTITLDNKGLVDAIDQASQGLSMEDLRTLENYEYYVSPAKVAIINALIETNEISSDLEVTKENADSLQAVIDEIAKYFDGVLEDDIKYLKGYPAVSAVQTKINAVKNGSSDDDAKENPSDESDTPEDQTVTTPNETTKTPNGTTKTAGGTSKSAGKASKTGDFEPIVPMFMCMLIAAVVSVSLKKKLLDSKK